MAAIWISIPRVNGGIISLAAFVIEHDGAIEYDLLTKTGHELRDVGRTLSWEALASFVLHIDGESALSKELDAEHQIWATTTKTNGILADIYDMLAQINANLVSLGEKKPAKPTKPYPRPNMEDKQENVKHYGKGALPRDKFRKWLEKKRKERNARND